MVELWQRFQNSVQRFLKRTLDLYSFGGGKDFWDKDLDLSESFDFKNYHIQDVTAWGKGVCRCIILRFY